MATQINSKHQKVSGKSSGRNAPMKKSGYAQGSIPDVLVGTKVGVTDKEGYSGPEVARADRNA
jgi:hypothetical protein